MEKTEIRKKVLNKRNSLSREEIAKKSRAIFDKLIDLPEYKEAGNVLVYASMGSEVETDDIILDGLASGKNVFCPKCIDKKQGLMQFVRIHSLEDLREGYYGIREPEIVENSQIFGSEDAAKSSLAVVPGVVFDKDGNRLGYGGGYYDRFLARFPLVNTAALCYKLQMPENVEIPTGPHDVSIETVITE